MWEARTPALSGPFALTLLRSPPETRDAALRDLRAAARVRSPHFVVPLDLVEDDGSVGIVSELVRGRPIAAVSPLRATSLLDLGNTLARALAHLHAARDLTGRGVVHGALRPSSLLLDEHGRLVITDLGTRRLAPSVSAGFAPEGEEGDDPRQDLFAAGALLWALVTEGSPLRRADGTPVSAGALHRDRAACALVDAAVPGLSDVLLRCLHPVAEDRFVGAGDLGEALSALYPAAEEGRSLGALGRPLAHTPSPSASGRAADPRTAGPRPAAAPVARAAFLEAAGNRIRSGSRFLFVDGPAGSGRTTFLGELVKRLGREHPGGHRWVDAAGCRSTEDLVCAVLEVAGAEPDPTGDPARVGRILARRGKTLLVLDGVDGIGAPLPALVHGWLQAAPEVVVLCGGTGAPTGVERVHLDPLADSDAAALWGHWRGFRPEDEGASVDELAALIDGRTLALRLLARCPEPVPVLAKRLRDRLALLGPLEVDPGVRGALDLVMQGLSEASRAGLAQLSVFEGAFGLSQAAAVLDLSAWPGGPLAGTVLAELVDRGLVSPQRPREHGDLAAGRSPRWRVPEAVRGWALDRASVLDLELTRLRHRACVAELGHDDVERAACGGFPGWRPQDLLPEQWDAWAALERALDDEDGGQAALLLRAASVTGGDHLPAARIWRSGREVCELELSPVDRTWAESLAGLAAGRIGRAPEQESRHQAALVAAAEAAAAEPDDWVDALTDPSEVAALLREARRGEPRRRGRAAVRYAELLPPDHPSETRHVLEEALRAADRGQDPRTSARAAHQLGLLLARMRDADAAVTQLLVGAAAWHQVGEGGRAARIEADLGGLYLDTGRPDAALRHLVVAATAFRMDGALPDEAGVTSRMGEVSYWCGRFDGALHHLDDALRLQRRADDREGLARTLGLLGLVHTETGRLTDARDAFEEALALPATPDRASLLLGRLMVTMAEGKSPGAREVLAECLHDGRARSDGVLEGRALWLLGRASFREGHPDAARGQLESAVALLNGRTLGWRALAELDLANVLDAQGEGRVALDILERTLAAVQSAGFQPTLALALCARARLHLRNGRVTEAQPDVAEARRVAKAFTLGTRAPLTRALASLA